jgi:subtilisin family serine protease
MIRAIRFLALFALLAGAVLHTDWNVNASDGTVTVIVELRDEPAAVYAARARRAGGTVSTEQLQAYRADLSAKQDAFLRELAATGINATVTTHAVKGYDGVVAAAVPLRYTLVFNGLTLRVAPSAVAGIAAMPAVKKVHHDAVLRPALHKSVNYINAPKVYGGYKELTPFDDLREGFEGQGIYISVIDTGIDWTHPMFGGDPTPPRLAVAPPTPAAANSNKKVVYYLPLAETIAYDGYGHGTHVASTAAGYLGQVPGPDRLPNTADDIRVHGVAPQARLMSYKVCNDVGSAAEVLGCLSSSIIMALEDSVSPFTLTGFPKPVAHVINMSLGGPGGPETATAVAASNAALTGTVVVAASGNSGPGDGTTGSPAAGKHVISVGATTHPGSASLWSLDMPGHPRITLLPMQGSTQPPASSITANYVYVDSWSELGPMPASVRGRIALVKDWAGVTFFDMSTQAAAAGAVALVFIRDDGANAIKTTIPAALISSEDGQAMVDALSSTDNNEPANGAVSEKQVKLNRFLTDNFMGEMAGFSSRGPVVGFGQIKPDVSAPGVSVLAAVPPGSVISALATAEYLPDPNHLTSSESTAAPNYFAIDGTSMATPHIAGVAALLKQAHPDWTPDMIRAAMINTATNMRDSAGTAKADGPSTADSIIAQGGGLIDVAEAVNAKALMGVVNSDPMSAPTPAIAEPAFLASHSYGEVPVINSRTTHTSPVTVTVRDLSGQGGTYNLAVANNRDLQLAGINVSLSRQSAALAPGGSATFQVSATVDGDLLRDVMAAKTLGSRVVFERLNLQWFVTARRADGAESIRMPFFFRPGPSVPAVPTVVSTTETHTMPAGDAGAQRDVVGEFLPELNGVTYMDIPFQVDAATYKIDAKVEWFQAGESGLPDLDYQLLDPDGEIVDESGNGVGPEEVSVRVDRAGTYVHRVIGFANAATDFTVTTTLSKGSPPPALQPIQGEFRDSQDRAVDFDGAFTLSWQPRGGERSFEVERSADGGESWEVIAAAPAGVTSLALADQPEGTLSYRVRGLHDGQIGSYVTTPSDVSLVVVSRRVQEDITALVQWAMVDNTVSFSSGVFQFDQTLKNTSANDYVPLVEFRVVKINSASGTVSVANADNGGDGRSASTAALFDYSRRIGADDVFSAGETTGARTLRFNVPRSEMFSYDVLVTAYRGAGGGTQAAGAPAGGGGTSASSSSDPPGGATALLRFTANPLTSSVSAQLVSLKL